MKINVKSDCRGVEVKDVVKQILKDRKIKNKKKFLNPSIDDMLPLTDLKNVDKAWDIICHAINDYKRIAQVADVDSDGVTSATIMYKYFITFRIYTAYFSFAKTLFSSFWILKYFYISSNELIRIKNIISNIWR